MKARTNTLRTAVVQQLLRDGNDEAAAALASASTPLAVRAAIAPFMGPFGLGADDTSDEMYQLDSAAVGEWAVSTAFGRRVEVYALAAVGDPRAETAVADHGAAPLLRAVLLIAEAVS